MKTFKRIFLFLLVLTMVMPLTVKADDKKEKVTIYFFRGEGCHFCEDALQWLADNDAVLGEYYNLVTFETWYNQDNKNLLQEVANYKNEDASGVPYILFGNYSYPNGFAADTEIDASGKTMGEQFIERLKETYDNGIKDEGLDDLINNYEKKEIDQNILERFTSSVSDYSDKSSKTNTLVGFVTVLVIAGIIGTAFYIRKNS